jgi:hypothetical protein
MPKNKYIIVYDVYDDECSYILSKEINGNKNQNIDIVLEKRRKITTTAEKAKFKIEIDNLATYFNADKVNIFE